MEESNTTLADSTPDITAFFVDFLQRSVSDSVVDSILGILGGVWNVYIVLAYLLAAFFMWGFVFASMRNGQLAAALGEGIELQEKLYAKSVGKAAKNDRFEEIERHINSDNPNDWRLAIIEADIMLDDILKKLGYAGTTLGERLKSITPSQVQSIDDAWQAHRVRNEIAHAGADFVLTQRTARDTINQYRRVFEELGEL